MYAYAYLTLDLFVILPLAIFYLKRPDLRQLIVRAGAVGIVLAFVGELFYKRNYWQPPGMFGANNTVLEDALFGFSITALGAILYAALTRRRFYRSTNPHEKLFLIAVFFGIIGLLVGTVLQINSGLLSVALFTLVGGAMLVFRSKLLIPALLTATILSVYMLAVYVVVFVIMAPGWWQQHWLLNGTTFDVKLFHNIPLMEITWYMSWGFVCAVLYPFLEGDSYRKIPSQIKSRAK